MSARFRVRARGSGVAVLLLALGASPRAVSEGPSAPTPRAATFSVLALGDTGYPSWAPAALDVQIAVGRALAAEDRRRPVDALILLGDNFYPDGLEPDRSATQIRDELVEPYCWFVDLGGSKSEAVRSACSGRARRSRPIPLFAVLGNHDYDTVESPELEREEIPRYVANWHLPREAVEVVELSEVSLVLYDSTALRESEDLEPLVGALRESRGPWRVLAAHHPLDVSRGGDQVRQAIARAGVPVHLHLAGHDHNLQIAEVDSPELNLQVISGGGSRPKRPHRPIRGRRFLREAAGFARIDLVHAEGDPRLSVSLVEVPPPWQFWKDPQVVARWSVGRDLSVRDEAGGGEARVSRPGPEAPTGAKGF